MVEDRIELEDGPPVNLEDDSDVYETEQSVRGGGFAVVVKYYLMQRRRRGRVKLRA